MPQDMQNALASAKMAEAYGYRKHDDSVNDAESFKKQISQYLSDLKEVFQRFRDAGLKLEPKKCSFAASACAFLGHLISKDGIRPPPDRVTAISDYPRPKNIKELRRLLRLFNWFRKFIPNYRLIASKVADVQEVHLSDNLHGADTIISDPYDADTDENDDNIRKKSSEKNVETASNIVQVRYQNLKTNNLRLTIGDYVYLQREPTGVGRKFQPIFDSPYVVINIPSSHLFKLCDPTRKRKLSDPVHINRLV
ncbi:unnamed protein product [Mytilus coruscus]|uniref:Uncharacterized protein n=1 Tax=Mytilus coruscus TaxID=42192 RepID=A0A6J8AMP7_MYTCO|nr:unnamed protein product [Mytilus coruscus]